MSLLLVGIFAISNKNGPDGSLFQISIICCGLLNISEACRTADVGRGTFYYWQARFEEQGYDGLEEFEDHAPGSPNRIEAGVAQAVIDMKQAHEDWGKKRIAQELAKKNNWVPVISPNTVKRVLEEAGLWDRVEEAVKKK